VEWSEAGLRQRQEALIPEATNGICRAQSGKKYFGRCSFGICNSEDDDIGIDIGTQLGRDLRDVLLLIVPHDPRQWRKQSRLLYLDGAATSWLFVTLPGSRAVSVLGGGTLPAGLPGVDPSGAQMRPGAGTGRPANCGGTCCQV